MREHLYKAKRLDNGEVEGTELTLIQYITPRKALFRCSCGNETVQNLCDIEKGKVKSCGCKRYRDLSTRNKKHGEAGTRLYRIWRGIKTRCQNTSHKDYADYGMRGIVVCQEWNDSYESFRNWALSNGYKENLTIERKDVDGNYEPSNCCWITKSEQSKNQRPRKSLCKRDEHGRFIKNA